ncbi:hypothetical protein Glove_122g32 [Diversispora epigaea]|uniref:Uncharacterized protein n=1 Tax=Diversispora epigaea TaxID=1348612 RepID=A0A397J8D1_9GLOM|nr:hypothetical protein Glove_122g32 [Diversispora epigaea]
MEKVSATNLKNLAYTILKNFNNDTVKNKKFTELPNCIECNKKIFQQMYPFPDCDKNVEILEEFTELDSQFSISSLVGKMGKQLNIQFQEIIDEEMADVDNEGDKDNNSKVDSEETNTTQDKSSSKKAKKKVKNEDFQMLK